METPPSTAARPLEAGEGEDLEGQQGQGEDLLFLLLFLLLLFLSPSWVSHSYPHLLTWTSPPTHPLLSCTGRRPNTHRHRADGGATSSDQAGGAAGERHHGGPLVRLLHRHAGEAANCFPQSIPGPTLDHATADKSYCNCRCLLTMHFLCDRMPRPCRAPTAPPASPTFCRKTPSWCFAHSASFP